MIKKTIISTTLATAIIASSIADPIYLKTSLGSSKLELDSNFDDTATQTEIGLGYSVNNWLSLESSYFVTGKFDVPHPLQNEDLPTNGRPFHYAPMEMEGFNLTTRFKVELSDDWSLFTRQGFTKYNIKQSGFGSLKKSTIKYAPTLGLSFTPSSIEQLTIDLEYGYESFSTFDSSPIKAKLETIRLGLGWKL